MREATAAELANWHQLVLANPDGGNTLQFAEFAAAKALSGWRPRYYLTDTGIAVLVLVRSIPCLGELWYLAKAPGVTSAAELQDLLPELVNEAKKRKAFLLKIEPEIARSERDVLNFPGLEKGNDIQAAATIVIDISTDSAALFKSFDKDARYSINRAEREGGVVAEVELTEENIDIAYRMLANTAEVGEFRIRPKDYYEKFWLGFAKSGLGKMFFAYYEDNPIAIAYIIVAGNKASYKDGASVKARPVYGASHLLQWAAIKWAAEQGATSYDFTGLPPSDRLSDKSHPLNGLVHFKTSFTKDIPGTVKDYIGVYDLVVSPLKTKLWRKIGDRIARRLHNRKRNEPFY